MKGSMSDDHDPAMGNKLHRIVVVGGGAGGLELVTRLGDKLGRRRRAEVALVERSRTHLWKPLLTRWRPAAWTYHGMSWTIWRRPIGTAFDFGSAK